MLDKWCFALTHIGTLDRLPEELRTEAFERLFQACEIARFEPEVKLKYEKEMITERDYYNMLNTAKADGLAAGLAEGEAKGRAKGREEGLAEGEAKGEAKGREEGLAMAAKEMKKLGLPTDIIIKSTGLSEAQIAEL